MTMTLAVSNEGFGPGDGITRHHLAEIRERAALRNCLEQLVAGAFQIDEILLRQTTRGRANVARARQVAMYLAHTVCGLSLTETGLCFDRDRTTVAHACLVVEDARDQPAFDRAFEVLEQSARIVHLYAIQSVAEFAGGLQ